MGSETDSRLGVRVISAIGRECVEAPLRFETLAQTVNEGTLRWISVLVERYGEFSWVVGTDYPHADAMGSWPHTVDVIKARKDLSLGAQDAILGGNALRLFDCQ